MYRFGAMLLAALLFLGCSNSATETAKKSDSPAKPADTKKTDSTSSNSESIPAALESKASTPETEFVLLQSAFKKSQQALMIKVRSAKPEEQMEIYESGNESEAFAVKHLDLANANPDAEFAFDATRFAAQNGSDETASEAFTLLADKFSNDDRLGSMLQSFDRSVGLPNQYHEDFLDDVIEKTDDDEIKGAAFFTLFKFLQNIEMIKVMIASNPEAAESVPETVTVFLSKEREDLDGKLNSILDDISENYSDVEFGRKKLGSLVKDELFVLNHLSVGKVAPDIEGVDLDGKEFKLSDYRGKVVMLDFWGDW